MGILLQISAGQGPIECHRAVELALKKLFLEAERSNIEVTLLENTPSKMGIKSALLSFADHPQLNAFVERWTGTMLWVCELRKGSARKNWYFSGQAFNVLENIHLDEIEFESCRSSGAGGQHVNVTNSAVRATHRKTGLTVKIQTERSQHANKKMAIQWLGHKISELNNQKAQQGKSDQRLAHHQMERGNPKRTFEGLSFKELRA